MGGGNAQKSAMARQRNLEKSQANKNAGGGIKGQQARSGVNMAEAMAAAAAAREEVRKKKEEKEKKK